MSDRWALFRTPDNAEHLVFLREVAIHRLHRRCWCRAQVRSGIVVHNIMTPVIVYQQRREREH